MNRLTAPLLLVLSLLFAQAGAQAHAYSHLRATQQPTAVTGVVTPMCVDCLAFAPLFSATHSTVDVCNLGHRTADVPMAAATDSLVSGLPLHAFRSRAPPSA